MIKVLFIATTGGEVEMAKILYDGLANNGEAEMLVIDMGMLCCEKYNDLPMEMLDKLGMSYKPFSDYGKRNAVDIVREESPNVVVVGSDQEFMRRAFVYAANGLNIPTLLLDVAIGTNRENTVSIAVKRTVYRLTAYFSKIVRKYCYLLRTVVALRWSPYKIAKMIFRDIAVAFTIDSDRGSYGCTAIVVAGSWGEDVLLERGVSPDKIFITGNPVMGILSSKHHGDNTLRQDLGIGAKDKIILLLTCDQIGHGRWTYGMRADFINDVIDSLSPILNESMRLVIKIHPVESLDEYASIIDGRTEGVIIRKALDLEHIIGESEIVLVGGYSTAILQATALGKPVILLNVYNELESIPFAEMGLAVELHNLGELKDSVEEYIYNKTKRGELLDKAKKLFDSNKEFMDGRATERIAEMILKLADK